MNCRYLFSFSVIISISGFYIAKNVLCDRFVFVYDNQLVGLLLGYAVFLLSLSLLFADIRNGPSGVSPITISTDGEPSGISLKYEHRVFIIYPFFILVSLYPTILIALKFANSCN